MKLRGLFAGLLLIALRCGAQCITHVSRIPNELPKENFSAPVGSHLAAREFIHARFTLENGRELLLYGDHNDSPGGFSERGLIIIKEGHFERQFPLKELPVFKSSPRSEEDDPIDSYSALSLTTACDEGGANFWLAFHWQGDITSPELIVLLAPSKHGYAISSLPLINGGEVRISRRDTRHVTTWDSLFEGRCNACQTHYRVQEYRVVKDRAVLVSTRRSTRLFSSGDFDRDEMGVYIIP